MNYYLTKENCQIGTRVKRGPEWSHGNQDGGGLGTIVRFEDEDKSAIIVRWDNSYSDYYRGVGYETLQLADLDSLTSKYANPNIYLIGKKIKILDTQGCSKISEGQILTVKAVNQGTLIFEIDGYLVPWSSEDNLHGKYFEVLDAVEIKNEDVPPLKSTSVGTKQGYYEFKHGGTTDVAFIVEAFKQTKIK